MNKGYNEVELTEEEVSSLENPDQETTASQTTEENSDDNTVQSVDAEQSAEDTETEAPIELGETEVEVDDDFDGFEIDGQRFEREDVLNWRTDSENKTEWQKSNTEKAQKLSKWNKLAEKIQGDDTFREHIKDFFYDNPEAVKGLGLDGDMTMDEVVDEVADTATELPTEVESRLKVLEEIEGERVMEHRVDHLDGVLTNLENQFPDYLGNQEQVGEFLEFADRNAKSFVENGIPNLERAFREWSYGQMQSQLKHYKQLEENGNRNKGKVIGTDQVGAKEVKSTKKLSRNWKEITMDDPEIAKYFDK
tara:strand:- start:15 stop:935 length:921 start_codon:yes stop_codon:yes gene_type:complete